MVVVVASLRDAFVRNDHEEILSIEQNRIVLCMFDDEIESSWIHFASYHCTNFVGRTENYCFKSV